MNRATLFDYEVRVTLPSGVDFEFRKYMEAPRVKSLARSLAVGLKADVTVSLVTREVLDPVFDFAPNGEEMPL